MRYEEERRQAEALLDKQAATLRVYRWGSLAVLTLASVALYGGYGTLAMIAFVVAFVYWRDTRNREQSLANHRLTFGLLLNFAVSMEELTDRVDTGVSREPEPNRLKSFMDRVERR